MGYHFGIDGYLTKPIDSRQLHQQVEAMASNSLAKKKMIVAASTNAEMDSMTELLSACFEVRRIRKPEELTPQLSAECPDMVIVEGEFAASLPKQQVCKHLFFLELYDEQKGEAQPCP